jgi:hypothetical protein
MRNFFAHIGLALAAFVFCLASLAGTAQLASASSHSHRCTVNWTWQVRTGSGGYFKVIVSHSCSGTGVEARALCKLTPTQGRTITSSELFGTGSVRAQCPSGYQVSTGGAVIGGTYHQVYP